MKLRSGSLITLVGELRHRTQLKQALAAGLRLGQGVDFSGTVSWGSEPWLVEVGDNTALSGQVVFVTHDGGTRVWRAIAQPNHMNRYGPIRIGANCFIGYRVIILPDVQIGDNCVIGAGSVVTRDIPSGSVAAGNPARVVSTIEDYGRKLQDETLLQSGHSPDALWAAVWQRFDDTRAARRS